LDHIGLFPLDIPFSAAGNTRENRQAAFLFWGYWKHHVLPY
jgi:hypothetical protein